MSGRATRRTDGQGGLLYVVPYLNDPAVRRRLRMLRLGGQDGLRAIGFRRTSEPITDIDGVPAVDLGRTHDGQLARRVFTIAGAAARIGSWAERVGTPSVVVARSLEALLLAAAYRRHAQVDAPLVYESLDIHGSLLGDGIAAGGLRRLEGHLLARSGLLVTSSPAFVTEYFRRVHRDLPDVAVLENKMLASELDPELLRTVQNDRATLSLPQGPPWTVGWFGLLRCRRSLELLAAMCRRYPGRLRVEVRGRPAATLGDRLAEVVAATDGMTYHGPYDRSADLGDIYSGVHYAWTLDMSEPGANSDWLLPNRLYEAGPFGCVPLASSGVETGRWLARNRAGVLLADPVEESFPAWFGSLSPEQFVADRAAMRDIPVEAFVAGPGEATAFVGRLRALRPEVST